MFEYPLTEQSLPHLYNLRPGSMRGRLVQSPINKPTSTTTTFVGMHVDTVIAVGGVATMIHMYSVCLYVLMHMENEYPEEVGLNFVKTNHYSRRILRQPTHPSHMYKQSYIHRQTVNGQNQLPRSLNTL